MSLREFHHNVCIEDEKPKKTAKWVGVGKNGKRKNRRVPCDKCERKHFKVKGVIKYL